MERLRRTEPSIFEGAIISTSTQITPRNPQVVSAEESEIAVPALSLRDFIQLLRRRRTTALATFATFLGLILLITLVSKPRYFSETSLLLEDKKGSSNSELSAVSDLFSPQAGMDVDSQVQLLSSPLILDEVYKESKIKPDSVKLTVERVERTSKIEISGVSASSEDVHKFVSLVPDIYRNNRRTEAAREVNSEFEFAKKDLAEQNQKLVDTEAAIAAFKTRYNLIDPDSELSAALQTTAQSKVDVATARSEISSLRAQVGALQSQLTTLPPTANTPIITTNPVLEELNNKLAELRGVRKDQSFLYKENSDVIRQIDVQIANLQARIASTPPTVTKNSNGPNPDVDELRTRIASLRADLSAKEAAARVLNDRVVVLEKGLGRYTDIQRQQSQLKRNLEMSQGAVKDGQEKVRQLSMRARAMDEATGSVTILEAGTDPIKISPKPVRNIIIGIFIGALLACAAALLQDSLDDRVRDEEEARQILRAPVLGHFPLMPVSDERQILDLANPNRMLLESFRALRSNVQFALVNSAGKKLQVTSTVPNEGKSYIASNLAITMAMDGRSVIIVDADLHRPTMHERFGAKRQPGLTNVLVGEVRLEDALQDAGFPNLRILSGGALPPNPAELLNSPSMNDLMKELETMADLIIFDTPPLLATSDSQLMSSKMDGVIFVMQMGSVARSGTLRAFELLQQAHANLVGVVFNKVDTKQGGAYGNYGGYYALESTVPDDEILGANAKKLPPVEQEASHNNGGSNGSGVAKKSDSNGSHTNGSNGQATVFDEALNSDENAS